MPFSNKEKRKEYFAKWAINKYYANKSKNLCVRCMKDKGDSPYVHCTECNKITGDYGKKYRKVKKELVFNAYGGCRCNCCGETEIMFLTIDHINGGGTKHMRTLANNGRLFYDWLEKNNFPPGYQVLCQNCNTGKYRNGGICPHNLKSP